MTEEQFRAQLTANGYGEIRSLSYEPYGTPDIHTHGFSAMGMVTSGALTLVYDDRSETFGPGEWYEVPAGTRHAEHTAGEGATALLGTRTGA